MAAQRVRLPRHFPIGAKLVVEDHGVGGAHLYRSFVILPDGRRVDVPPAEAVVTKPQRRRNARRR